MDINKIATLTLPSDVTVVLVVTLTLVITIHTDNRQSIVSLSFPSKT